MIIHNLGLWLVFRYANTIAGSDRNVVATAKLTVCVMAAKPRAHIVGLVYKLAIKPFFWRWAPVQNLVRSSETHR